MLRTEASTTEQIFHLALEALKKHVPAQMEVEALAPEPGQAELRADRLLRMAMPGRELHYHAEIKTAFTQAQQGLLLMRKEKLDYPFLLITRYVDAHMAEELRGVGMEFIDTAGNAFINQPPLYIFVKGNKPPEIDMQARPRRAFNPSGLRIIYAFLCDPGLPNKTYREIAAATDTALGTVAWVMRELRDLGFLLEMGGRRRLISKEDLLDRWVAAYPERLRPKQTIGRYRGEYGWWEGKKLNPRLAQWGGEVAADTLTHYLKPEVITIYARARQLDQLLMENRLRRDPTGDVEILEGFWNPAQMGPGDDLVHPILIYADLLATGNQRNVETARRIYEQHIVRLIGED